MKKEFNKDGWMNVNVLADLPDTTGFLVLGECTYQVAGYDLGDPSEPVDAIALMAFVDEDALLRWVEGQEALTTRPTYKILRADPVFVERTVTLRRA